MHEKIEIKDLKEAKAIIAEKLLSDMVLIEEQIHEDGIFLIFEEKHLVEKPSDIALTQEDRIKTLEVKVKTMEDKLSKLKR